MPGQTYDLYALGPADFAKIYNSAGLISGGNNGSGQTIAIVGETNINVSDIQSFRQLFGLPANFTATNVILNGEDPGITSTDEEGEADLDVQWSGAVAPNATIDFVVSASTPASQGVDLSALYIIEYNLAGVMSESYGNCEAALGTAGNAFYNSLWQQAAAQGITAILAAGDAGSAACDDFNTATTATQGIAVSGMASTPYNIALGGTDFDEVNKWSTYWSASNNATTGESALSYIPEIPWNQSCAQISLTGCGASAPQEFQNIVAGSGGPSAVYAKPKWQMGVSGMPNDSQRDLPDVSLFASPGFDGSGYIVCQADATSGSPCSLTAGALTFLIVGGTSASAPTFAGIMALVNQYQSAHGGTSRQGNANYILYPLAKKSGASCASSVTEAATCIFNDVTHGNSYIATEFGSSLATNSVPCLGGSPNCSATVSTQNGVLVQPASPSTEAWMATAGYDLATGLGSVNVNNLATNWGSVNTVATTTTLTLSPTTGITHGTAENVTVNITVSPKSGTGTATGEVSLIATIAGPNGATTQGLNQFTLDSTGKVVNGTTDSLPGGTNYQVYAHYAGDGTNAPSDSAPVSVTVSKETSQTFIVIPTFDSSGNQTNGNATSVTYGSNYYIRMYVTDKNAVASPTGPPAPACYQENSLTCPSGTVTLTDNGNALGTGGGGAGVYNLNNAGYTRNLTPNLTGGSYTLVASYTGDNSYQQSTSTTTFIVDPAPVQLSLVAPSNTPVGVPISFEINGTTNISGVTPTGTLAIYDGTTSLRSWTISDGIDTTGAVTLPATIGPHSLTAHYSGDSNYAAAVSPVQVVQVGYPTTLSLQLSATTILSGNTLTLTATLTTSQASPPVTGQITFASVSGLNTVVAGSTTQTVANGMVGLQATATVVMKYSDSFTASYAGDANYAPSGAGSSNVTVNNPNFTLAAQPPAVTVTSGNSATYTVSVTAVNGFTGNVTFTCGLVAAGTSCSASPSSASPGGTTTITVTTTKHQQVPPTFGARPFGPGPVLKLCCAMAVMALLFFYSIFFRKRRVLAATAFAGLILLLGLGVISCGGGSGGGGGSGSTGSSGSGGTPAGSYGVTVTGTSGNLTNTLILTLNVQ